MRLKAFLGLTLFSCLGFAASRFLSIDPGPIAPVSGFLMIALGCWIVFSDLFSLYGKRGLWAGGFVIGFGAVSELCGLYTGLPFGVYEYTRAWWPVVDLPGGKNFPVLLPFAWLMVVGSCWVLVCRRFGASNLDLRPSPSSSGSLRSPLLPPEGREVSRLGTGTSLPRGRRGSVSEANSREEGSPQDRRPPGLLTTGTSGAGLPGEPFGADAPPPHPSSLRSQTLSPGGEGIAAGNEKILSAGGEAVSVSELGEVVLRTVAQDNPPHLSSQAHRSSPPAERNFGLATGGKSLQLSTIAQAALLATATDYLMEYPVVQILGYWKWTGFESKPWLGAPPLNFLGWFLVSSLALVPLSRMNTQKAKEIESPRMLALYILFMIWIAVIGSLS